MVLLPTLTKNCCVCQLCTLALYPAHVSPPPKKALLMPVIENGLWSSFLLTACLMLFSYHPLCLWCLPAVQQRGRKTDTMIVSAVQLILFCIIMDRAAVNKSPLVQLGSDGRLPVWLRDGVIADLVATPSDIPYLLSREESQPLMFTDNCPFFQSLVLLVHASENTQST